MTVCNVCTLNLRQASNHQLLNDAALRERVNDNLERVGAPRYETDVDCVHFLWLVAGESFSTLRDVAHKEPFAPFGDVRPAVPERNDAERSGGVITAVVLQAAVRVAGSAI